jgi:hypothetical protein
MSKDLSQIFDLERLRRAWGAPPGSPQAPLGSEKPDPKQGAATTATTGPVDGKSAADKDAAPRPSRPSELAPLYLLQELRAALKEEFPRVEQHALFEHLLGKLEAHVGVQAERPPPPRSEKDAVELAQDLDELEDLLDALSLPAA